MKLILGIVAWTLAASALAAPQQVDRTLEAEPDGTVLVDVPRGRAAISGWDRDEVRVAGRVDEDAKEFIFQVKGAETLVEVRLDRDRHGHSDGSDLEIFVPMASELEFKGVSADISVREIKGGVKGGTVSGDLNVAEATQRIDVGSVSGDVFVRGCEGRIRVNSVSGDIDVRDTSGEASYESVSGDIVVRGDEQLEVDTETISGEIIVDLRRLKEFRGESVSGEIEVSGQMLDGGNIELESVSGRVDLALDTETNARFEVQTGSGGIRNDLTKDRPQVARYSRNSELKFTMGDGGGLVVIGTASGRVVLRRR